MRWLLISLVLILTTTVQCEAPMLPASNYFWWQMLYSDWQEVGACAQWLYGVDTPQHLARCPGLI